MKYLFLILFAALYSSCKKSQCYDHEADLVSIQNVNQKKLDTGIEMLNTARQYNQEVDSVLTLITKEIKELDIRFWDSNLSNDYVQWEERKKIELDSIWMEGQTEFDDNGLWPQIYHEMWFGTSIQLNNEKAIELNRIKLKMCNE